MSKTLTADDIAVEIDCAIDKYRSLSIAFEGEEIRYCIQSNNQIELLLKNGQKFIIEVTEVTKLAAK